MTGFHEVFDPHRLTNEASLQRVVIAGLPGVPPELAGVGASETCSRDSLARLVSESGLPAPEPERLGDQLAELRFSSVATTRTRAKCVLRIYGARLGALLATLKHPGTPAEQGRTLTQTAYLEHWLGIERVWLGGGLLAPGVAEDLLAGAEEILADSGTDLGLRVVRSPAALGLLGAARLSGPHDGRALVADAGHTTIKTAVAVINGGRLAALETLPPQPVPSERIAHAVEAGLGAALALAARVLGHRTHRCVVMSVASYLDGDAPVADGRSMYGGVNPGRISQFVAGNTGDEISIKFVHDGTAGASGVMDAAPSAVLTVGTRLAIGFTPANGPLLPGDPVIRDGLGQARLQRDN